LPYGQVALALAGSVLIAAVVVVFIMRRTGEKRGEGRSAKGEGQVEELRTALDMQDQTARIYADIVRRQNMRIEVMSAEARMLRRGGKDRKTRSEGPGSVSGGRLQSEFAADADVQGEGSGIRSGQVRLGKNAARSFLRNQRDAERARGQQRR